MSMKTNNKHQLLRIVEGALFASARPLSISDLMNLFDTSEGMDKQRVLAALDDLREACEGRAIELSKVASGYRLQIREDLAARMSRLWPERPPSYSPALLETLAFIAYRQPVTRTDVESVRGTSVSTHTMRILEERGWVKIVGHRDAPGKPALYATTPQFLDYFNLSSLADLPPLERTQ